MKYSKFTDMTDAYGPEGEYCIPLEVERWGTEDLNIERCPDGHFSLFAHGQDLDTLNDDLVLEIYHLLGFYLEHQGLLPTPDPPAAAAATPGRCSWVELEELYQRMQDWTLIGAKSEIMSTLLNYEAWRVEMDAGRGTIEGSDGRRHTVETLFAPLVNRRRQRVRKAGTGRGRKRKAA